MSAPVRRSAVATMTMVSARRGGNGDVGVSRNSATAKIQTARSIIKFVVATGCHPSKNGHSDSAMAKLVKTKLPRVTELDDGRYAIDIEPGVCILFSRDGDLCKVEIALSRDSSEQQQERAAQSWLNSNPARAAIRLAARRVRRRKRWPTD
jgi:hypothetical protein